MIAGVTLNACYPAMTRHPAVWQGWSKT
jgi:hypothetical protein